MRVMLVKLVTEWPVSLILSLPRILLSGLGEVNKRVKSN